ncbi:MAG: DUF2169 domain-containing protein [Agarilytica sp.]
MLQLKNLTPFEADVAVFPDENGEDALFAMVKATFNVGKEWTLADEQEPLVQVDEYWGDSATSSLKASSDYHIGKSATDVLIMGHACAPNYEPVEQLDVTIQIGSLQNTLRVFGNRAWQNERITHPQQFKKMPMVYERAYGGSVLENGEQVASEAYNPAGIGFKQEREYLEGLPLPNIENPSQLISSQNDSPVPVGTAPTAPFWQNRAAFCGTYDDAWQTERAPFLPEDFNKRFLNCAPPNFIYDGFLQGGESVYINNMHERGPLNFVIPAVKLNAKIQLGEQLHTSGFELETLTLRPNELKATMVWRAKYSPPLSAQQIDEIRVSMSR